MAGVTDMAFRHICKEQGVGLIYTEMASSKAIHYGSEKTENIYEVLEEERPIGIQIFGHEPEIMAETAEKVNDTYLKANNQTDGTQSYGRVVDLLLAEYRQKKGN